MAFSWSWMRKTVKTDFIPTKKQEEQAAASGIPYQPHHDLVELGGTSSLPPNNWCFRKMMHAHDIHATRIVLSHDEMVNHVFQFWPKQTCKNIFRGKKLHVKINLFTGDNRLIGTFGGEDMYVVKSKETSDEYIIKCKSVFWSRPPSPGDEIELFSVDNEIYTFGLKFIP